MSDQKLSWMQNKLMTEEGYLMYCGGPTCTSLVRARFNGRQFHAACCGWTSSYSPEFIELYKKKWGIDNYGNKKPSSAVSNN